MRLARMLFAASMVCLPGFTVLAQGQAASVPAMAAPDVSASQTAPAAPKTAANQAREWVPDGIEALGKDAASRTEFRIDHSMLVLASKLDKNSQDLRRVLAGVNGIAVHSFRFANEVFYDSAPVDAIRQQYRDAAWLHLVSNQLSANGMHSDVWIQLDGAAIRGIAVLMVAPRQVNFVAASGSVTPLDLLHLGGHFGIPKMDEGAAVPVPGR
jgi:hypothetical protein